MQDKNYRIRTTRREEVEIAVEWAAQEGWNPGLGDAECFHAADPNGFLIGLLDGEPIATISVVRYGRSFGFLGFYIVKPGHRGQGHGMKIVFETARMDTGEAPDLPLDRLFGVTTFELG